MLKTELSQSILNTLLHTKGITGEYTRQEIQQNLLDALGNVGASATDNSAGGFYREPDHRVIFKNWTYQLQSGVKGKGSEKEVDPKIDTTEPTNDELIGSSEDLDLQVAIGKVSNSNYGIGLTTENIRTQLNDKSENITTEFKIGEQIELSFNRERIIADLKESHLKNTPIYQNESYLQSDQIFINPSATSIVWQTYTEEEWYYDTKNKQTTFKKVTRYKKVTDPTSYTFKIIFQGFLFEQKKTQDVYFPSEAYLGLFTEMPGVKGGTKFVEVPTQMTENGVDYTTAYRRMDLNEGIFSKNPVLEEAYKYGKKEDEKDPNNPHRDYLGYAYITNKEIIMFPEIVRRDPNGVIKTDTTSTWGGWGNIVGFGLFEKKSGEELPYFWGELEAIQQGTVNHVPLFRIKNFQLFLG